MTQKEWFASWFDSPYYHKLYKNRDFEEAAFFIDNLIREIHPKPGSKILDLACGKGRHSIYLAKKGYDVTGIDLSSESIAAAKAHEMDNLVFFQHDMRELFMEDYFDYILNLFTSFGYFQSDLDHVNTLINSRKGLIDKGVLIIDFMNVKKVIRDLVPEEQKTVDGTDFFIQRHLEEGYIVKDIRFEDKERQFHFTEKVRAFTLADFEGLFSKAGLKIQNIFGDYNLNGFDESISPRLILLTGKNA